MTMRRLARYPEKEKVPKDDKKQHDWFEVYGEIEPTLSSGTGTPTAAGGLYEYCWGLGYSEKLFESRFKELASGDQGKLQRLLPSRSPDNAAARVRLYFPADCNWRVSEILATVKHLSPVQQERNWREEFAKDFTAIEPVIGAAGKVAADATGMPELGSVAEAVSRLKLTSVPQATGTMWFVRKVDKIHSGSLFHGIEWQLSVGLLKQLGFRVAGGLLVSFASVQPGTTKGEMLAYAEMNYGDKGAQEDWCLINKDPLKLCLEPKEPERPEPKQPIEGTIRVRLTMDPDSRDVKSEAH